MTQKEREDAAAKMIKENPQKMIELMAQEIIRLNMLLRKHEIDPSPNMAPGACMSVTPSVKVFDTPEAAQKALEDSTKTS